MDATRWREINELAAVAADTAPEERDAEQLAHRAVDVHRAVYPAGHMEISRALSFLGRVLLRAGKPREAEPALRESFDFGRKAFPKDNWRPAESKLFLGVALASQGRRAEGQSLAQAALKEFERVIAGLPGN